MDDSILPRSAQSALNIALQDTPVVCILGARQTGKSTLTRIATTDRTYLDLDDENIRATALNDPSGFIKGLPEYVTLDEIQHAPALMRAIKVSVDRNRKPGRFILTGSANLLLLPQLSDSLAGRMEIIELHPLTESEKARHPGAFIRTFIKGQLKTEVLPSDHSDLNSLKDKLLSGGYPEAHFRTPARARTWHRQYLRTLIERDVHNVSKVRDAHEIERLIRVLAHQTGALINTSNLSRDLQIARATVDHYLQILERLFLIRRLPAWHRNGAKRLIKASKVHIIDSGLCGMMLNLDADDWNTKRNQFGALLESFVIQQLVAQADWTDPDLRISHYRDKDQSEVDCVLTKGTKVWGVEVKTVNSVSASDTAGLKKLAKAAGNDFQAGIVLYNGNSTLPLGGKLMAVPLSKLWEL